MTRYATLVASFAPAAQAFADCALTPDGTMYFLESNARPSGHHAAYCSFSDPLDGLECMLRQDHATLATHLREIDDGIELVVVLMQSQPVMPVDMARLGNLPGVRVHPASIMPGPSGHHSYRTATTFLTLEADTPEDAFEHLKATASAIGDAGDFLPINLERVRGELFGYP